MKSKSSSFVACALFVSNQSNKTRLKEGSAVISFMESCSNCSRGNSKESEFRGGNKNTKRKWGSSFYRATLHFLPLKMVCTLLGLFEEEKNKSESEMLESSWLSMFRSNANARFTAKLSF